MEENIQPEGDKKMSKKQMAMYLVIAMVIIAAGYYFLQPKKVGAPAEVLNSASDNTSLNQGTNSAAQESINPNANSNTNVTKNTMENTMNIQGMKVEILKEGTGEGAKSGDMVTVNYTGTLENGTKFDSSFNPGRSPFQFTLGQGMVIKGWELGVLGMKVGEKRKLTIPADLGYGASGAGGVIPPNATLIFEVDLLKIN